MTLAATSRQRWHRPTSHAQRRAEAAPIGVIASTPTRRRAARMIMRAHPPARAPCPRPGARDSARYVAGRDRGPHEWQPPMPAAGPSPTVQAACGRTRRLAKKEPRPALVIDRLQRLFMRSEKLPAHGGFMEIFDQDPPTEQAPDRPGGTQARDEDRGEGMLASTSAYVIHVLPRLHDRR